MSSPTNPPGYPSGEPAQPYPGPAYAGQPYPGQPYPGQPYAGQPHPGQPYAGQPFAGQPAFPAAQPGYAPGFAAQQAGQAPFPGYPGFAPGPVAGRKRAPVPVPAGVAALGGVVAIIAAFLTWVSASDGALSISVKGTDGGRDGNITLVLGIAVAIVAGLLAWRTILGLSIGTMVLGALIAIVAIIDISDPDGDSDLKSLGVDVSIGVGLWLTLAAGIAVLAAGLWALVAGKRLRAF